MSQEWTKRTEDGSFSSVIQSYYDNAHLLRANEPAEQLREQKSHF